METKKENLSEIFAAVNQYAQEHNIVITGSSNHLHSMFKYKTEDFPENTMFKSYNFRGRLNGSAITIVCINPDKITHCLSEHILERSKTSDAFNFSFRPRQILYSAGMILDF